MRRRSSRPLLPPIQTTPGHLSQTRGTLHPESPFGPSFVLAFDGIRLFGAQINAIKKHGLMGGGREVLSSNLMRFCHVITNFDQIAFFWSFICTGARRDPATCGKIQGD
jgi:hypothetical protein